MDTEYVVSSLGVHKYWFRGDNLDRLYRKVKAAVKRLNRGQNTTFVVAVWRVSTDRSKTWMDDFGDLYWENGFEPERIGLLCLSPGKKPVPVVKNQFNPEHLSHEEWIAGG